MSSSIVAPLAPASRYERAVATAETAHPKGSQHEAQTHFPFADPFFHRTGRGAPGRHQSIGAIGWPFGTVANITNTQLFVVAR